MCGIVGVFARQNQMSPSVAKVRQMRDSIAYRGPDQAGEYFNGPIALGSRRLSIIDLATGNQPITSSDGRYTIVFNGEIYNHQQLRTPLEQKFKFRTASDTETLLYHYIHHGPAGLPQLNGMFAFAIWDNKKQELFLARDRFGKKPLYYHENSPGEFLFGSEIKTILAYLPTTPSIDRRALVRYLLFEYIPENDTPFEMIKKLPTGSWMKISKNSQEIQLWWHLYPFPTDFSGNFSHPVQTLDTLLHQSVKARMIADVPVGILLSGGIDSTTIAWYMREHTKELHSFSVSFPDRSFNEAPYAQLAAQALHTHHHDLPFTLETFHEARTTIIDRLDEPLADASLLPTYAISQAAKHYVTVVLDGDGADELLYGYDTFPAYQLSRWYEKTPLALQRVLEQFIAGLPTRHSYFSLDFRLKSFLRGMPFPGMIRNQVWLGSFHDQELKTLLTPAWQEYREHLYQPITREAQALTDLKPLEQLSLLYLSHYLQGDILAKIDRATMYASLEARTPFLDPQVVSFLLRLPQSHKYSFPKGKQLLRKVMKNRIPSEILYRKKQGFGIPIGAWLRGPLRDLMQTTLAPDNLAAIGMVRPEAVSRLMNEHITGTADHRKKLWTLMILQWWWERWIHRK